MSDLEEKENFVHGALEATCIEANSAIRNLYYVERSAADQCVKVRYVNGYVKEVNVSGDSLLALARDVFAAI